MAYFIEKRGLEELDDSPHYSEQFEVFLTEEDVENRYNTIDAIEDHYQNPESFHTPWKDGMSQKEFYDVTEKTDFLADYFDSDLVVHHPSIPETWYTDLMKQIEFSSTPYLEHQAGTGFDEIYNGILTQENAGLTLDIPHAYLGEVSDFRDRERSEKEFVENLDHLFQEYGDQIGVVHLADATLNENTDGTEIGTGDVPFEEVCDVLTDYEVPVVVEVYPDVRESSWEQLSSYTDLDTSSLRLELETGRVEEVVSK